MTLELIRESNSTNDLLINWLKSTVVWPKIFWVKSRQALSYWSHRSPPQMESLQKKSNLETLSIKQIILMPTERTVSLLTLFASFNLNWISILSFYINFQNKVGIAPLFWQKCWAMKSLQSTSLFKVKTE